MKQIKEFEAAIMDAVINKINELFPSEMNNYECNSLDIEDIIKKTHEILDKGEEAIKAIRQSQKYKE